MSSGIHLYEWHYDGLTLSEAMQKFPADGHGGAVGWTRTPDGCCFIQSDAGTDAGTIAAAERSWEELEASAYEATYFNEWLQLYWRADARRFPKGRAVFASENSQALDGESTRAPPVKSVPTRYLLWGELEAAAQSADELWVSLSSSRVGRITIPSVPGLKAGNRVALHAVEYLGSRGRAARQQGLEPGGDEQSGFGNTIVLRQRFTGLRPYIAASNLPDRPWEDT